MEFTEVVRNRYSCKNFDAGKAVDAAKLTEILEAGRVAPTAKNFQEQKIYVIQSAEGLAKIADVDIETHAKNMFRAGSNFKNKTIEEIFFQDFKKFTAADKDFGVGQISAMGAEELLGIKDQIVAYMDTVLTEKKLNMVFIMLTDILEETTYLLCAGTGADQVAEEAFKQEKDGDYYVLKGVVSRKKQIIPPFMSVLQ